MNLLYKILCFIQSQFQCKDLDFKFEYLVNFTLG